jgi:K+-sensing histidine kinase KdpD
VLSGATSVTPFILFVAAVAVVALRAGFWPGAAAVALSAFVSDFLFVDPRHELTLGWGTAYLAGMYSAGVVGYLLAGIRRAPTRWPPPRLPHPERNGRP